MRFLHETLIVVGLAMLAYGFNQPWSAYDKAELQRIETFSQAERFSMAYEEFARRVNEQIRMYNSCVSDAMDCDRAVMKEKILEAEPESQDWSIRSGEAMLGSRKSMQLALHYRNMRNIWFAVGIVSCCAGIICLAAGVWGSIAKR